MGEYEVNKRLYKVNILRKYLSAQERLVVWIRPAESFKGNVIDIKAGFLILKDSTGFKLMIDIDDICVIEEAG